MKKRTRTLLIAVLFLMPAFLTNTTHAAAPIIVNTNDDSDDGTCDITHCLT